MSSYNELLQNVKNLSRNQQWMLVEELVRQLRDESSTTKTPEELGWPPGYFERAYGIQRHDPIERLPQPEYQERKELINEDSAAKTPEELGWPPGVFEQTFGSLRDDPIVRQPQPEMPVREALILDDDLDK